MRSLLSVLVVVGLASLTSAASAYCNKLANGEACVSIGAKKPVKNGYEQVVQNECDRTVNLEFPTGNGNNRRPFAIGPGKTSIFKCHNTDAGAWCKPTRAAVNEICWQSGNNKKRKEAAQTRAAKAEQARRWAKEEAESDNLAEMTPAAPTSNSEPPPSYNNGQPTTECVPNCMTDPSLQGTEPHSPARLAQCKWNCR